MKLLHQLSALLLIFSILIIGCQSSSKTQISGTIDYLGNAEFYLEKQPLHYKYSVKEKHELTVNEKKFSTEIEIDEAQIIWLVLQDIKYPLFVEPGSSLSIDITRASFPFDLNIYGYENDLDVSYNNFLKETIELDKVIKVEMDKFKVGQQNRALAYSQQKLDIAEKYLSGTPFNDLYLKVIGEDLVLKLRAVEYSDRHIASFDAEAGRDKIFAEAEQLDFFSLESLTAQRAGIRDFTHYYSRTFGIYDSVLIEYNLELAEYDLKRLAYEVLDKKRLEVVQYIDEPQARAYAKMFLVAERIGEQPFEISKPTYTNYLSEYSEYPEYTDFLNYFYGEIESVSPGQPGIPFSLPDRDGNMHTLDEYKGKFVLLDFWAGWCQPCLAEFSYMRDIYNKYSREELEILAISTEVDKRVWIQDINKFQNPWPQLYGGKGVEQETFKAYKGGGIPFYILLDPDGNIIRYNDIRPSFNFIEVLDNLILEYKNETSSSE